MLLHLQFLSLNLFARVVFKLALFGKHVEKMTFWLKEPKKQACFACGFDIFDIFARNLFILSGGDTFHNWGAFLFKNSVPAVCAFYSSATQL
jgi:hypothetical protein